MLLASLIKGSEYTMYGTHTIRAKKFPFARKGSFLVVRPLGPNRMTSGNDEMGNPATHTGTYNLCESRTSPAARLQPSLLLGVLGRDGNASLLRPQRGHVGQNSAVSAI